MAPDSPSAAPVPLPIYRPAARVLLLDDRDRLLLFRVALATLKQPLWITPGGGLESGESFEQGAARELFEETGLRSDIGPCIWTRRHCFEFQGRLLDEDVRFFVVRCAAFEPVRDGWEDYEHQFMDRHQWWSPEEIAASTEYFAPRRLGSLLPSVVAGDYPPEPIDAGV